MGCLQLERRFGRAGDCVTSVHSFPRSCVTHIVPGPPPMAYTVPLHLGSRPTVPLQRLSDATQLSTGNGLPIAYAPQLGIRMRGAGAGCYGTCAPKVLGS